ncbi:MAG TPA: molybdopterin cofactor-binding domain-containing protein, partial [Gaiellaceae bacterium]|nr:molybdopterin cofactor-binding domain-containing protein [Gaiellaceae bacterium]
AESALQPLLARVAVRDVGEPVAVVVAEQPHVAEDAAELVELDLEELEPAADLETAPELIRLDVRHGDVDAAFARADVVVRRRLRVQRLTACPLETRGLLAEPEPDGRLALFGAAKVKHWNRQAIADLLGLDAARLRLVEVEVGGGFGARGELYPEDVLVPLLALRLGRPVRWVEDRAEHLVATNHAREQVHDLEVAVARDGRLLAFRDSARCDQGAYVRTQGLLPAMLPADHLPGPYAWEAFAIESAAVRTNRTPVGTFRGPGMTEATFVRERALDVVASELGLDPVDLRRRNLIPAAAMPFRFDLGPEAPPIVYESGDYPAFFERLLEESGFVTISHEVEQRRARGETVGVGVAAGVELGAIGPFEDASVVVEGDGNVVVRAGVGSLGQGVETVLAQIAAEELGVELERVSVHHHDTDDVASGFGSYASRSTVVAGNAVALAARALRERAAAEGLSLAEAGEASARFDQPHPTFSFGAALSVVSLDCETGAVRAERHVVAHDVGRAVNPALLRGQLVGAAAQGIGAALLEELPYDETGQPLAVTLADYLLPTAAEVPEVETVVIEHPVAGNPLGVKGGGEAGMVTAPAAVANAVADALGDAGEAVARLPLTPQRVRGLASGAGRDSPPRT